MPTVFHSKSSTKTQSIRLRLPESILGWLDDQAKEHSLSIHEAATQALTFARQATETPSRGRKPKPEER